MSLVEAKDWLVDYKDKKRGRLHLCTDDRGARVDSGVFSSAYIGLARIKWKSFDKRWGQLLNYIENGPNSKDGPYGESVLAEIITFQLLDHVLSLYKHSQQLYLTPLSLDFSSTLSRGFDILIAEDYRDFDGYKHFYDGQYVKKALVGFDVTIGRNIRNKKKKVPYNINLQIPVLIVPLESIPGFRGYLEKVRLLLASGQISEHYLPGLSEEEILSFSCQLLTLLDKETKRAEALISSGQYPEITKCRSSILEKLTAFKEGPLKSAINKQVPH